MRQKPYLFSTLLVLCSCGGGAPIIEAESAIEYRIEDGSYAVVVVQSKGSSQEEAKQLAVKKAAELAKSYNYRYFTIVHEETVQVSRTEPNPGSASKNLYYEAIESGNLGREQITQESQLNPELLPAYKIIIQCYKDNPPGSAIEVCKIVKC